MKTIKYFLPAMLAVAAFTLTACGGDDDDNGGKKGNFSTDYVDLGLSVKWATCNLGAKNPWEAGNYYAWGETSTKSVYSKDNYVFRNTKISNQMLRAANDAATATLGSAWHTPTGDEVEELIDNCDWTWTVVNGVAGSRVTGKNGNSIFIPVSGYIMDASIYHSNQCYIWTNESLNYDEDYNSIKAKFLYVYNDGGARPYTAITYGSYYVDPEDIQSWSGMPVRAVRQ